jgi:hypothetical protein
LNKFIQRNRIENIELLNQSDQNTSVPGIQSSFKQTPHQEEYFENNRSVDGHIPHLPKYSEALHSVPQTQKPDHGPIKTNATHSYGVNNGYNGISPAEMFASQPPTQCQPTHIDTMSSDHFPSLTPNIVTINKLMHQLQQQAINSLSTMPPAHMPTEQYQITNATMTLMFPHNITIPSSSQPAQAEQTPRMRSELTNFKRNVSNEEACLSHTIEPSHVHDKTESNMIQSVINKENQRFDTSMIRVKLQVSLFLKIIPNRTLYQKHMHLAKNPSTRV